jgi:hypothetical protein
MPAPVPRTRLTPVWVFGLAMGWLEGVVVVYLRALLGVPRTATLPDATEVLRRMHAHRWLVGTEQSRELATLLMLAAVGWLAGTRLRSRVGAFLVAFGVWDLAYYGTLWALLRWPPRLTTMDLLFLLPEHRAWYQPVWVPMAIAGAMVIGGSWLAHAHGGRRGRR